MKKYILVPFTLVASVCFAETNDSSKIYSLANTMMDVVSHTKEFLSDGHYQLNEKESDLVLHVASVDNAIGNYLNEGIDLKRTEVDCLEKNPSNLAALEKDFNQRSFRVGAVSILVLDNFNPMEKVTYGTKPYDDFMATKGKSTTGSSPFVWASMTKRIAGFNPDGNVEENSKKITELLKKESGIVAPTGTIASELLYRKLLSKPDNWKQDLTQSGALLNFDEKVALVAKLGESLLGDYNDDRAAGGSGIIPIELLLKNVSLPADGGVCRDIALAQSQMLKALGVKDVYSVGYSTIGGGHVTLVASDPNDKNRIIKINYGEMYTDDGKKGSAALLQGESMPNTGLNYRIYDSEGKPVASIPTELGKV